MKPEMYIFVVNRDSIKQAFLLMIISKMVKLYYASVKFKG